MAVSASLNAKGPTTYDARDQGKRARDRRKRRHRAVIGTGAGTNHLSEELARIICRKSWHESFVGNPTGTERAALSESAIIGRRWGSPEGSPAGDGWGGHGHRAPGSGAAISRVLLFQGRYKLHA